MQLSYSPAPIDTVATARDFQDRVARLAGAVFIIVAVMGAASAATHLTTPRQLYGLLAQIREIGKLGQYTLEEKIGEGGMGRVYRATHALLRRPAAIKLLSKERVNERDLANFEREVQLTSRLAHPNTISIFDYGRTSEGVFYYVMEYLDGMDLDRLVKEEGPLAPPRAVHILTQVCGALEPDVVKVLDFGLVKTLEQNDSDSRASAIAGTPTYLAPEAIVAPETVDSRADICALGAKLRSGAAPTMLGSSATMAVDLRGRNDVALAIGEGAR